MIETILAVVAVVMSLLFGISSSRNRKLKQKNESLEKQAQIDRTAEEISREETPHSTGDVHSRIDQWNSMSDGK